MKNTDLTLHGRNEFVTPFSSIFDKMMRINFPSIEKEFGLTFGTTARPKVDINIYDDKIQIIAEIAGLTKDDVEVSLSNNILTIRGDKTVSMDNTFKGHIVKERSSSKFERSFELNDILLDSKNIKATFRDGILTLDIPKVEPTKPDTFKIEIK